MGGTTPLQEMITRILGIQTNRLTIILVSTNFLFIINLFKKAFYE